MNIEPNDLEAELAAMTPVELSPQLRRRIEHSLRNERGRIFAAGWQRWAGALAVAACVGLMVLLWRGRLHGRVEVHNLPPKPPVVIEVDLQSPPPTSLAAYRLALSQSPLQWDALLDGPSASTSDGPSTPVIRAFVRIDRSFIP